MSRKHCKRKVYALMDPITLAISGAAIPDAALLDKLRILELAALQAWADGSATTEDWKTFADLVKLMVDADIQLLKDHREGRIKVSC